jgi:hypothetical protein
LEKYRPQEVALNKLKKGPFIHFKTVFCSRVALTDLEKRILKDLASFRGFSFPVWKVFRICEPCKPILKRPTQGSFLQKNLLAMYHSF